MHRAVYAILSKVAPSISVIPINTDWRHLVGLKTRVFVFFNCKTWRLCEQKHHDGVPTYNIIDPIPKLAFSILHLLLFYDTTFAIWAIAIIKCHCSIELFKVFEVIKTVRGRLNLITLYITWQPQNIST